MFNQFRHDGGTFVTHGGGMLELIINGQLRPSAIIGLITTVVSFFFVLVAAIAICINKVRERKRRSGLPNERAR